jgi:hypothetical protein
MGDGRSGMERRVVGTTLPLESFAPEKVVGHRGAGSNPAEGT